jgi:hypothetical protein
VKEVAEEMPGGGLFSLVAYGSQNVLLSGNPDMTYFYKTFKKYTHFSLETTSKLMDGPTDYPYDKGVQLKARIDRVGDLLTDLYFSFQIPAIYSKYQATNPTTGPRTQQEFQWVRYLGLAAIESIYVTVGPNKIQEFTGEYLIARALVDYPADKFAKWQQMVGDVPELYDPANGLYGNRTATNGEYPTVYADSRNPGQGNTPSIPATTIQVPIPFWFTEQGQGLPLVGLQAYTVDITVNLRPANQLFTTLDLFGHRMASGYRVNPVTATNPFTNTPDFISASDTTSQLRNFFTDFGVNLPPLNSWTCNPTIHTTYAFLPEKERTLFATAPLMYVTRQITLIPNPEIYQNEILTLDIHNPITRLILIPRRSDSVLYKNNLTNFTNWVNYPTRPKIVTQVADDSRYVETANATGLLVPAGQKDILQYIRVLADGNEIQELKPTSFYTKLTPYKYLAGQADTNIPVITFELNSPTPQPAGSLNSSRIRKFQLDLQIYPLPPKSSYIYQLNIYVENLNFFLVESGMGDNKYAL